MELEGINLRMSRIIDWPSIYYPQEEAIVNVERGRRLTFEELANITNQMANALIELGVEKIATMVYNDNQVIFCRFSVPKLPILNLWLGIRESFASCVAQIEFVNPSHLFVDRDFVPLFYEYCKKKEIKLVCMDEPPEGYEDVENFSELWKEESKTPPDVLVDITKPSVIRYTAGTTGEGKPVARRFLDSLIHLAMLYSLPEKGDPPYSDKTRLLLVLPATHMAGLSVWPTYFKGGKIVTLNKPDIELICQTIERERITMVSLVPTVVYRILDAKLYQKYDLSSLKILAVGGQAISPARIEQVIKVFGRQIFVQGYGSTEAFAPIVHTLREDYKNPEKVNSIGRPLLGVDIKIVDENGKEVPPKTIGELWISAPTVARGYYKRQDLTTQEFTEEGYWKSGDLGYYDEDGYIFIYDRKKDMIKTGGWNVYAQEVEDVLNSHPAVAISCVIGIPHPEWGEAVHAEVVLKEGAIVSEEELKRFCKEKGLASYKVPKSITFVRELPLSPVGKVLRRFVREKYWKKR
ncbi:MAG: AMP-binding protein [Archaeoglobaceae archaeon]